MKEIEKKSTITDQEASLLFEMAVDVYVSTVIDPSAFCKVRYVPLARKGEACSPFSGASVNEPGLIQALGVLVRAYGHAVAHIPTARDELTILFQTIQSRK